MTTLDRNILHLDLDTFFVSVERLLNSKLMGKPVVIGGTSDRGVVASCSYEARHFGIHAGMPIRMAKNLCGNGLFIIRGDMDQYNNYSRMVTDIITEQAPVFEKTSIDEHYIDLTGMDKFFGCMTWSHELRAAIIKHTGLPISFGLSLNKTVSKIATGEAKPNGELQVPKDMVKPFLSPLSIRKIPGVGEKSYRLLRNMGIITIHTLSDIPVQLIEKMLGASGLDIWKKANGIDTTPVKPYSERKSISTERTFEKDTTDIAELNAIIVRMAEKLGFKLRKKGRLTSCITVKIRYSNFDTHTQQRRVDYTSFDHTLMDVAKDLFAKVYNRRMLIRLIGVKVSNLIYGYQQLNLFEDTPKLVNLYQATDGIKNRYDAKIIGRAISYNYKNTTVSELDEFMQFHRADNDTEWRISECWKISIQSEKKLSAMQSKAYFNNARQTLLDELDHAEFLVWITLAWFTDTEINHLLMKKRQQGINIELIVIGDPKSQPHDLVGFYQEGCKVYCVREHHEKQLMNRKSCIIDLKTLINSSNCWNAQSKQTQETITIVKDASQLIEKFAHDNVPSEQPKIKWGARFYEPQPTLKP